MTINHNLLKLLPSLSLSLTREHCPRSYEALRQRPRAARSHPHPTRAYAPVHGFSTAATPKVTSVAQETWF